MWSEVLQVGFLWPKLLISVISQARVEPTGSPLAYIDAQNTKIRFYSYFFSSILLRSQRYRCLWLIRKKKTQLKLDFPINERVQGFVDHKARHDSDVLPSNKVDTNLLPPCVNYRPNLEKSTKLNMLMAYDVLQWLLKEKDNTKRRRYCIDPYFNSLSFTSPLNNIRSTKSR